MQISHVSKSFSSVLFEDVNLRVSGPTKIGLIGDNGSGKSTFLKMIAGQESVPTGKITFGKDAVVGYLEQELGKDLDTASGGEKKLIKLSQLFYSDYNVILLDEPDNHLDIDNRIWFQELVKNFDGILIVISHDRSFLRKCVDKIWFLDEEKITEYPYSYDKFAQVYGDNLSARKHLWEVQEKERKRLEALVKEYQRRASMSKDMASAYKSMIKRYERFVEEMTKKPPEIKTVSLGTSTAKQPARKTAIHLKDLVKSYGKNQVLKGINLHLFCGDKIAISAPNGSGKSTLLNIIAGRLDYDFGEVYLGPNLIIGNYTQDHLDSLDENATPAQELQKSVNVEWYKGIGYLKRFMFSDSQINSAVKYLSGGQKSRLQLAKFLGTNPDVLILDEPTNHLDLKTVIALEQFLAEYPGTLILVSHDRELVEKVVDKIYLLADGKLEEES